MRPLFIVALLACACITSSFELLDQRFEEEPAASPPKVLREEEARSQYRVVGVLDIFYNNLTRDAEVLEAARREGQPHGCDALLFVAHPDDEDVVVCPGPVGGPYSGSGPCQSEAGNRARFLCAVPPDSPNR